MEILVSPRSRFAWPGSTLRYHIEARAATGVELSAQSERIDAALERVIPTSQGVGADLVVRLHGSGLD